MFVNFAQEKVAMTPFTKCVETFILIVFAAIVIIAERKLFLCKKHIGVIPNVNYIDNAL